MVSFQQQVYKIQRTSDNLWNLTKRQGRSQVKDDMHLFCVLGLSFVWVCIIKGAKIALALEDTCTSLCYDVNLEFELCCLVSREPTLPVERVVHGNSLIILSLPMFASVKALHVMGQKLQHYHAVVDSDQKPWQTENCLSWEKYSN